MRKKIAFIKPGNIDLVGGGERVLINIANHLSKDYDVSIVTYSSKESFYRIDDKVKVITLGLNKSNKYFVRMFQPIFYIRKLARIIKENEMTDVVAFSDVGAFLVFFTFLFHKNYKKYVWLHNSYYQPINRVLKLTRLFVLKHYNKIIVLNKLDEAIYKQKLGDDKAIRLPNPLSFELNSVSNLENKKILSIGRLHKEKGLDLLIESAKSIFKERPDWKLDIIGQDRGEEKYLRSLIKQYELADNIFIKEPIADVQNAYLESSIYVMTSHFECLPLVLTEAAEAGLPLVAFNSPSGISDIVIHRKNGILVERFNVSELSESILELINSSELRKRLGDESKRLNHEYHIEPIVAQWHGMLEN